MALEDICSFKSTHILTPAGLHRPLEDVISILNMPDLGRSMSKTSELNSGIPLHFSIPSMGRPSPLVSSPSRPRTVQRPFPLSHGTTTLGFIFNGGVIAAADSRASAGGLVACPAVQKITPVHSHLVVTSSGSGADCMLWERILAREIRLYQLRHKRYLSISGTAKMLSLMLHPFKGTDVCVALTLCGWDRDVRVNGSTQLTDSAADSTTSTSTTATRTDTAATTDQQEVTSTDTCTSALHGGPKLVYVCSDGMRLQGDLFSVGSGSPYAYAVLDGSVRWDLSRDEAVSLAREAVFRATHRDAYSGNNVDLFHVTAQGWTRRERENLREEYYKDKERIAELVRERKKGMSPTSA